MSLETFREADLAYILADAGVKVRAGAAWTWGVFKAEGTTVLQTEGGSGVLARELSVTIRTGALDLEVDSELEIQATTGQWTSYIVRDHAEIGDGAMTRYLLAEA